MESTSSELCLSLAFSIVPSVYFIAPTRHEFTLLMGAIEKGGELEPRDFCKSHGRRLGDSQWETQ